MDVETMKSKGASAKFMIGIGFRAFSSYMERRIEVMFAQAISPVMTQLKSLKNEVGEKHASLKDEMESTDPTTLVHTIRDVGISFGHALNHVLDGYVKSNVGRMTLEEELKAFHQYHEELGSTHFDKLPNEDFDSLQDYVDYLLHEMKVPANEVDINGGAQFRRLLLEVEIYLRDSEVAMELKKSMIIQARGVAMGQLTWRDVVVKLLTNEAHLPMRRRVMYAGERIKWFFMVQKEAIAGFMSGIRGSSDESLFSGLYAKKVALINENEIIKHLVFTTLRIKFI
jgi:hypothetical protein